MTPDEEVPRKDQLKLVVDAFRRLEEVDWSDWDDLSRVTGKLARTGDNLKLAARLQDLTLADTPLDLASAAESEEGFELTLMPPTWADVYFARSLDSMLERLKVSKSKAPAHFFLASPADGFEPAPVKAAPAPAAGYLHPDEEAHSPELVARYLEALRFVEVLQGVENYEDDRKGELTLIFFFLGNLELPINYSTADLRPLRQLDRLQRLLLPGAYQEQMRDILKSALREILGAVEAKERFAEALRSFHELFQRFEESYELFISQFSFAKVREQVEEHRLAYTAKLNGVFAGIQDKLLAIPVALVIAASQMKHESGAALENFFVLVGALVFAGLMVLLLRNQRDTLQVIHEEIRRENTKLEREYREIRARLEDAFTSLEDRYRHQRWLLKLVGALVWSAVLFPLAVFAYYTWTAP